MNHMTHTDGVLEKKDELSRKYRQISNIRRPLVGSIIVDHSDAVGASPVSSAPPAYIFILDLTPSFNRLGKSNYKTRR